MARKKVNLEQFAQILERLPGKLEQRTINGLRKSAMRLVVVVEHHIRNNQPFPLVDRGRLVQSVQLIPTPKGAIVRVDAPYAPVMEWGARPFSPPLEPLLAWAKRKGLDDPQAAAWAIQRKFRREGIKPRRFFARSLADWRGSNTLSAEVRKALEPKGDE